MKNKMKNKIEVTNDKIIISNKEEKAELNIKDMVVVGVSDSILILETRKEIHHFECDDKIEALELGSKIARKVKNELGLDKKEEEKKEVEPNEIKDGFDEVMDCLFNIAKKLEKKIKEESPVMTETLNGIMGEIFEAIQEDLGDELSEQATERLETMVLNKLIDMGKKIG